MYIFLAFYHNCGLSNPFTQIRQKFRTIPFMVVDVLHCENKFIKDDSFTNKFIIVRFRCHTSQNNALN
jgi:hypothetical protein